MGIENNIDKYKEVVHYIIDRCETPSRLGSVKLNKILLFSDGTSLISEHSIITGDTYIKRQFGPVPKNILKVLDELIKDKAIVVKEDKINKQKLFFSLVSPKLKYLTASEVSILDEFIEDICNNFTAKRISDITHNKVWELSEIGETIDLYNFFIAKDEEIDEEDINALLSLNK